MTRILPFALVIGLAIAVVSGAFAAEQGDASGPGAETRQAVEGAVAAVLRCLVRIHVVETDYQSGREIKSEATGSGVIFTADGHVITNHHVAGHAKQLVCKLASKEDVDAELIGSDPLTDICVIKLLAPGKRVFPAARFGDSSALRVGDTVLAMGSPEAISPSVTMGVVSNMELVVPELFWPFKFELEGEDVGSIVRWIGHDADLNPGSSGGPLVNLTGEVVGINEMELGVGAAIPGNLARGVAGQLIRDGKVKRAWIGLDLQPLLRSQRPGRGALVGGTVPGSPAEKAGFQGGDILVSLGGKQTNACYPEELPALNWLIAELPVGERVEAEVLRAGKTVSLTVTPEPREAARPRDREFAEWGMTARDLSLLEAKERRRQTRDGALVTSVRPGGPCEEARPRILVDDVITEMAGRPVRNMRDLAEVTNAVTADTKDPVSVTVLLDRQAERYLTVAKIGKKPVPEPAGEARKAWLGVRTQVLTREMAEALKLPAATGARVTQVLPGTSAQTGGLQVGDLILALDGSKIPASRPEHSDVFPAMVRQYEIGSRVDLTVIRGGQQMRLAVTLDESPKEPREMKAYRDDNFEFSARDVAFDDRVREQPPAQEHGVLVESVTEGGWAALAHLAVGDLVLKVDGYATPDVGRFAERMREVAAERRTSVVLQVRRGIHTMQVELLPKWSNAGSPGSER